MFTKEQFIKTIQHETQVCKHLFGKIPSGGLEYRPTAGQRSLLELLQYLTAALLTPTRSILSSDWSHAHEELDKTKTLQAEQFCEAMDRQCEEVIRLVQGISDQDLLQKDTQTPLGQYKMGEALVICPLKFISCYRMQLFLYLKSLGVPNLTTYNCWGGIDKPAEAPKSH